MKWKIYLYFFTVVNYEHWDGQNKAATRVCYFEKKPTELFPYKAPLYISDTIFPRVAPNAKGIEFSAGTAFPDLYDTFEEYREEHMFDEQEEDYDEDELYEEVDGDFLNDAGVFSDVENGFRGFSHMLGHENYIQQKHDEECAEVFSELYGEPSDADEWLVLLEYAYIPGSVQIAFHIRREDLENRRFDRVWSTTDFD